MELSVGTAELRALLDGIPARVVLYDRDRRHRYVNRDYANFVGREPEAILGHTLAEVMGPEAYARLQPHYAQLRPHWERALNGEASRWEGWLPYSAEGEPCFVQRFYLPHRGPTGVVDGYFIFTRDLTELKRSEQQLAERLEALRASEALNAAITASALDCVVVVDEAGHVIEFNPAAERTFGYERSATLGRPIGDLIVPPALRGRHAEGFRRYLTTGQGTMLGRRVEIEAMRSDGTVFPVELAITEVKLPERRLFTAYLRDLTEARAAADEIRRQRDALVQSERMAAFGSLLAGVAHELNNPLSIVLGGALMLKEEAETVAPPLVTKAERIQVAAERCSRIVRSFLAMARQQAAERRPLAAADLMDDVLNLLAYGLRSAGVEVERDVPPDLPPLLGDADQLHQVLANLVTNARQALERQPGPRRLFLSAREVADGMIEIAVEDNGSGIPADVRGRIFDPFFTTKPVGVGNGIGLAVSRGIAEAHGGTLDLAEQTTGGARFLLRLPRAGAAAPAAQTTATNAAQAGAHGQMRALIVDDEPALAQVVGESLAASGFACDLASTGREAQTLLAIHRYDAILCDLRMPDIDGPALYAWMASEYPHLCKRIAFATGDTLSASAAAFLAGSGRPVLEKPLVPADLRRVIASLAASAASPHETS